MHLENTTELLFLLYRLSRGTGSATKVINIKGSIKVVKSLFFAIAASPKLRIHRGFSMALFKVLVPFVQGLLPYRLAMGNISHDDPILSGIRIEILNKKIYEAIELQRVIKAEQLPGLIFALR
jgi:hypothetical protein